MTIKIPFQLKNKLSDRKIQAESIKIKHPDRIPIIITKNPNSSISDLKNCKFLVPTELTISQLIYIIRKKITLKADEAINIFIITMDSDEILPPSSSSLGTVYNDHVESKKNHKNYDGYLYIVYSGENVFG
jgi:GABA(A) receptor-associated protein